MKKIENNKYVNAYRTKFEPNKELPVWYNGIIVSFLYKNAYDVLVTIPDNVKIDIAFKESNILKHLTIHKNVGQVKTELLSGHVYDDNDIDFYVDKKLDASTIQKSFSDIDVKSVVSMTEDSLYKIIVYDRQTGEVYQVSGATYDDVNNVKVIDEIIKKFA